MSVIHFGTIQLLFWLAFFLFSLFIIKKMIIRNVNLHFMASSMVCYLERHLVGNNFE